MVIPTWGSHRRVRRELLLSEDSGGQPTSSRTCWVLNVGNATPRGHSEHTALRDFYVLNEDELGGGCVDRCAGSTPKAGLTAADTRAAAQR
jgi:hypothetical protein